MTMPLFSDEHSESLSETQRTIYETLLHAISGGPVFTGVNILTRMVSALIPNIPTDEIEKNIQPAVDAAVKAGFLTLRLIIWLDDDTDYILGEDELAEYRLDGDLYHPHTGLLIPKPTGKTDYDIYSRYESTSKQY